MFDGYEGVDENLANLVTECPGFLGQFATYPRGEKVAGFTTGGASPDDEIGIYPTSTGASAMCIALLADRDQLDLDVPTPTNWPVQLADNDRSHPCADDSAAVLRCRLGFRHTHAFRSRF